MRISDWSSDVCSSDLLADRLVANSFADTVFFCNSGVEALEGSTKVARRFHFHNGEPNRTRIICCTHSFHGRTLGMLSATDKEAYREGFGPRVQGFSHVAFGNPKDRKSVVSGTRGEVRVETGGRSNIKKKKKKTH